MTSERGLAHGLCLTEWLSRSSAKQTRERRRHNAAALSSVSITCSVTQTNNHRDVIFILKCLIIVFGALDCMSMVCGVGGRGNMQNIVQMVTAARLYVLFFSFLFHLDMGCCFQVSVFRLVACLKTLACVFPSQLTLTQDVMHMSVFSQKLSSSLLFFFFFF